MLSIKLVQLVETHWDQISERILRKIRNDARLAHINRLSESELRKRAREIVKHIGDWLGASLDEPVAQRCEALGRQRFEEGIPLHEVVLARFIIKEGVMEFVHDHAFVETSLQLYAEGELEKSVGHLRPRDLLCNPGLRRSDARSWPKRVRGIVRLQDALEELPRFDATPRTRVA